MQYHLLITLPLRSSFRDIMKRNTAGMFASEVVLEKLQLDAESFKTSDLGDVLVAGFLDLYA